jgi:hypothetical protein
VSSPEIRTPFVEVNAADLLLGSKPQLRVEFQPTYGVSSTERLRLIWREDDGNRRVDEVLEPLGEGDPQGTFTVAERSTTPPYTPNLFCDWGKPDGNTVFAQCQTILGTSARQTVDFVYLLTTGTATQRLGRESFNGYEGDCYVVRYVWMLSPEEGKLCVSVDGGFPTFLGNRGTGDGFEIVAMQRVAASIVPDVATPTFGRVDRNTLKLPAP